MGLFSKKEKKEGLICDYSIIYRGGLADYPKSKSSTIDFLVLNDRFELKPTFASKSWFKGLIIRYDKIKDIVITERQVSTVEGILGGLDSKQLNQKNNIHITFETEGAENILRIEMLSGITVMGQAKKCLEFEDRLKTNGIRDKFSKDNNNTLSKSDDIPSQIEKLADLLAKGILTQEEFDTKKTDLLSKL